MTVMMSKNGSAPVPVQDHRVSEWQASGYVTVQGGGNAPVVAPDIALKQWLADYLLRAESVGIDQQTAMASLMSGQASLMGGQAGLMNAETARLSAMLAARGPANWAQFANQAGAWMGGGLGSHAALAGQTYPQGPGSWADMQTKAPNVSNIFGGASTGGGAAGGGGGGGGGGGTASLAPTSPGGGTGTWGTNAAGNQVTINRVNGSRDMDQIGYEGIGNPRRYLETLAQMYAQSGVMDSIDSEGNLNATWDENGNPVYGENYTGPRLPRMPENEMEAYYFEEWVKNGAQGDGPAYMYPAPGESQEAFEARMAAAGHDTIATRAARAAAAAPAATAATTVAPATDPDDGSRLRPTGQRTIYENGAQRTWMPKGDTYNPQASQPRGTGTIDDRTTRDASGRSQWSTFDSEGPARRAPSRPQTAKGAASAERARQQTEQNRRTGFGSRPSGGRTETRRFGMATGGVDVVKNPTTILAGEGGKDELHVVIPLERSDMRAPKWAQTLAKKQEPGSEDKPPRRMATGGMLAALGQDGPPGPPMAGADQAQPPGPPPGPDWEWMTEPEPHWHNRVTGEMLAPIGTMPPEEPIPMAEGGMLLVSNSQEISPGAKVYDAAKPFNLKQTTLETQKHYGVKNPKLKKPKKGVAPGPLEGGAFKPVYVNELGQSQQLTGNNKYRTRPAWQNLPMLDPTRTPAAAIRTMGPRDIELNQSAMEAAGGDWATFAHSLGQSLPPWAVPRVAPRPRRGF